MLHALGRNYAAGGFKAPVGIPRLLLLNQILGVSLRDLCWSWSGTHVRRVTALGFSLGFNT